MVEKYLLSLNPYLQDWLDVSELDKHEIQSCNYKGILRRAIMTVQNDREKVRGLALAEHAISILSVLEMNTVLGCVQACESLRNMFISVHAAGNPIDKERNTVLTNILSYNVLVNEVESLFACITDNARGPSDRFRELLLELRKFAEKVRWNVAGMYFNYGIREAKVGGECIVAIRECSLFIIGIGTEEKQTEKQIKLSICNFSSFLYS